MRILIDSARLDEVTAAARWGFVGGVTTNPALMHAVTTDPLGHLNELIKEFPAGDIYYQPTGITGDLQGELEIARTADPDRVVLKLPVTRQSVPIAAGLVSSGARVALTAAQYPLAIAVAEGIGCEAVIPYVDRAARDLRTPTRLVAELARMRRGQTKIIAASIKSSGQFAEALLDGADAVSAPYEVLAELIGHPAATEAEAAFGRIYGEGAL